MKYIELHPIEKSDEDLKGFKVTYLGEQFSSEAIYLATERVRRLLRATGVESLPISVLIEERRVANGISRFDRDDLAKGREVIVKSNLIIIKIIYDKGEFDNLNSFLNFIDHQLRLALFRLPLKLFRSELKEIHNEITDFDEYKWFGNYFIAVIKLLLTIGKSKTLLFPEQRKRKLGELVAGQRA